MTTTSRHILGALLMWCMPLGCANDIPTPVDEPEAPMIEPDMAPTPSVDMPMDLGPDASFGLVTWPDGLLGSPCNTEIDCAAALGATCARLLGDQAPGVCTIEDCVASGCPVGGRCTMLGQTSACLPEAPDFCAVECGDPLECALDLECLDRGCCGSGACPSICGQMSYADCEMSARCAASCCQL